MMTRIKNKFKKLSTFKKIVTIYFGILIISMIIFLIYINSSLVLYQNNQIDTYLNNLVETISKNPSKYIDLKNILINELETNDISISDAIKQMLKDTDITYEKDKIASKDKTLIYAGYSDSNKIFDVTIEIGKEIHRMGLLTFNLLNTKDISFNYDRGIYYVDIIVPSNFKVEINGTILDESFISSNNNIKEFGLENYDILPTSTTYKINDLLYTPEIIIYDSNNNIVTYEIKDRTINCVVFSTDNTIDETLLKLVDDFDVLDFAEKWSLFFTNDLDGGFNSLRDNLIKDSYMLEVAYSWATSIDRTFVSKHTLNTPTFTNETVNDCAIYNDRAFSCVVHLEKNMTVAGNKKIDVINDRMYFIYYDDTNDKVNNPYWKLVNTKAITGE
jgi:hypothetical protein